MKVHNNLFTADDLARVDDTVSTFSGVTLTRPVGPFPVGARLAFAQLDLASMTLALHELPDDTDGVVVDVELGQAGTPY